MPSSMPSHIRAEMTGKIQYEMIHIVQVVAMSLVKKIGGDGQVAAIVVRGDQSNEGN